MLGVDNHSVAPPVLYDNAVYARQASHAVSATLRTFAAQRGVETGASITLLADLVDLSDLFHQSVVLLRSLALRADNQAW
ncbi:MAG TPA: hypothetical protein VHR86_00235 [Armatimonadota bacterium]|nr:hypothetical protein [Armatimonadota bacterium]